MRKAAELNEAEKATFKLVLGLAAGGLMPMFHRPTDSSDAKATDTVTETLAALQPYKNRIAKNGIAYRGRPALITDALLRDLQEEARTIRPKGKTFRDHHLGCGAPIANNFALSRALLEFVRTYAGDVQPTGVASFIFYDQEGQGISPHIDTDIFSLNVLLMLHHHWIRIPLLLSWCFRREPSQSASIWYQVN
jgi:hypothetical protein